MSRRLTFELAALGALLLQYQESLRWLGRTWHDATYESWGVLPVLLLVPALLRPPPRRARPSWPHLAGLLGLASIDLLTARLLQLHVLSALLAVVSLHLWATAFRRYPGRWYQHRQLWLGLAALPAVFWGNLLFGYPLQHLATRMAAAGLRLYGLSVSVQGNQLDLPGATVAVDAGCSGVKLLYGGLLFGLLAAPAASSRGRRWLFGGSLFLGLLAANAARVMCLVLAQLQRGRPLGEGAHQAVGLLCFLMVAAGSLPLLRRPTRGNDPAARGGPTGTGTQAEACP